MSNIRLKHDIAWKWAIDAATPVAHMLNQSEQREFIKMLHELAEAALSDFIERSQREIHRLYPSEN